MELSGIRMQNERQRMPHLLWTKGHDKISPDGARGPKVLGGHEPGRGSEVEFSSFLNPN